MHCANVHTCLMSGADIWHQGRRRGRWLLTGHSDGGNEPAHGKAASVICTLLCYAINVLIAQGTWTICQLP